MSRSAAPTTAGSTMVYGCGCPGRSYSLFWMTQGVPFGATSRTRESFLPNCGAAAQADREPAPRRDSGGIVAPPARAGTSPVPYGFKPSARALRRFGAMLYSIGWTGSGSAGVRGRYSASSGPDRARQAVAGGYPMPVAWVAGGVMAVFGSGWTVARGHSGRREPVGDPLSSAAGCFARGDGTHQRAVPARAGDRLTRGLQRFREVRLPYVATPGSLVHMECSR